MAYYRNLPDAVTQHNDYIVDIPTTKKDKFNHNDSLKLFGIEIGTLSVSLQLVICTSGFVFFKILQGYFQELIFATEGFTFGIYLTLFQMIVHIAIAYMELRFTKSGKGKLLSRSQRSRVTLLHYFTLSVLLLLGQSLANSSMNFINFPTKVIFRSSKLIPGINNFIFIHFCTTHHLFNVGYTDIDAPLHLKLRNYNSIAQHLSSFSSLTNHLKELHFYGMLFNIYTLLIIQFTDKSPQRVAFLWNTLLHLHLT